MIIAPPTQQMPADQFVHDLTSVCGSYDFDIGAGRDRVWGGVKRVPLQDWEIALVATDMARAVKTTQNIRHDASETIFLILQQSGQSYMRQGDRNVRLMPGDLMLIDSAYPSEFIFSGHRSMQVSLHLPRHQILSRFGAQALQSGALRADNPTSRAIHAILAQVCGDGLDHAKADLQREVLYGLLGLFLIDADAHRTRDDPNAAGVIRARADQVVSRDFRDPTLSVDRIASDIGTSLRSLQRAYAGQGDTLTQVILDKRLDHAQRLLATPRRAPHLSTISAVAFDAGFSDISYFNRRFRAAYGCTPREYQHQFQIPPHLTDRP